MTIADKYDTITDKYDTITDKHDSISLTVVDDKHDKHGQT